MSRTIHSAQFSRILRVIIHCAMSEKTTTTASSARISGRYSPRTRANASWFDATKKPVPAVNARPATIHR